MYDLDDTVIPKSYWNKFLEEINNIYFGDNVLYFIRLWNRYEDIYFYKLGFTDNLKQRIISLNNEYDSCGRIIIIALCNIKSQKAEKIQYKELKKISLKLIIKQKRKKECYSISAKNYDQIIKFMRENSIDRIFFESQRYILSDDNEETLDNILLSKDKKEEKMWHSKVYSNFRIK